MTEVLRQWDLLPREQLVLVDHVTAGAGDPANRLPVLQLLLSEEYQNLTLTWIGLYDGTDSSVVHGDRALLRSFAQERPHTHTITCDLDGHIPWQDALTAELRAGIGQSRDVRYRDGQRQLYRLQHVLFDAARQHYAPGLSLVLGGLGGIGRAASELLLRRRNQTVLVVGRTRHGAWQELTAIAEMTAGRVFFIEHDLVHDDVDELRRQVRDAERASGLVLSTIVQATGTDVRENPIQASTPRDYTRSIRENDRITRALETLAADRPGIQVIEIGSVNGSFGGSQVSAYAYRKGYELGRHERFAQLGISYINVQQTMWTDTGMSVGKKNLGFRKGYASISKAQGLQSLAMILDRGKPGLYYAGIDGRHRDVQSSLTMSSRRRLLAPDGGIVVLEERLPLYARGRQLALEDEHGDVVGRHRRGRLSIRAKRDAEPLRTSLAGTYDGGWRIDLETGREQYSGYQLDTREVAAVLRRHPSVRDCHVHHKWDEHDREQLVAFLVTDDAAAVQAHVREQLPLHLQPGRFVVVEELPRTRGGLADGTALERLAAGGPETSQARVAPRNDVELRLAGVWEQVLSLEPGRLGVDDSFFELGGNSLVATQLVSRIRGHFDVDLQVKDLFDFNTIAGLAAVVSAALAKRRPAIADDVRTAALAPSAERIPPIVPVDRSALDRLPLSFAQERLWFIHQLEPESPAYNIPGAVIIRGELDVRRLEQAYTFVIARHENLRTVFPSENGVPRQRILDPDFRLERIDLRRHGSRQARREAAREVCRAEAVRPFDLANGPLLRGTLIELAEEEHILLVNMHHVISDAWSIGLLIREVGLAMDALAQGRNPELP
ncbi:MAG TPA: condensation domain-containing protein, partial [Thermoanaerobaculia bacterium]|nr:condensation domain-containing protein [Thermoanaerobaculia bacterium]